MNIEFLVLLASFLSCIFLIFQFKARIIFMLDENITEANKVLDKAVRAKNEANKRLMNLEGELRRQSAKHQKSMLALKERCEADLKAFSLHLAKLTEEKVLTAKNNFEKSRQQSEQKLREEMLGVARDIALTSLAKSSVHNIGDDNIAKTLEKVLH